MTRWYRLIPEIWPPAAQRWTVLISLFALLLSSCSAPGTPTAVQGATQAAAATAPAVQPISGLPACNFVPGQSKPAVMPDEVLNPQPTFAPTSQRIQTSQVDSQNTQAQLGLYKEIWNNVDQFYADPKFNGKDWQATGSTYEALIRAGLSEADFTLAMQQMLAELDTSPSTLLRAADAGGGSNLVGVGFTAGPVIAQGQPAWVVGTVFSGSPAEQAGVKAHDMVLAVDGQPLMDEAGQPRTLGKAGSEVTLRVQSPGQPPRDLKMKRAGVNWQVKLQACLLTGTRIIYLRLPDMQSSDGLVEMAAALKDWPAPDGLILDTRGAYFDPADWVVVRDQLAFFVSGALGSFVYRTHREALTVATPLDINGSQHTPLVVLVDESSGSGGGLYASILQRAGRAKIVGQTDPASLAMPRTFTLGDQSQLILAAGLFEPVGKSTLPVNSSLEPDVTVRTRWDLFSSANDPVLAKAVDLLIEK